jgi:hypothetical protein
MKPFPFSFLLKSEKEWKRFGLSLIPSNRCFVPFAVQIDLLPVIFACLSLLGPTPTFDFTRKKGEDPAPTGAGLVGTGKEEDGNALASQRVYRTDFRSAKCF